MTASTPTVSLPTTATNVNDDVSAEWEIQCHGSDERKMLDLLSLVHVHTIV